MTTLNQLATNLARLKANILHDTHEIVKDVAFNIVFNLIDVTPVDTSRALSNWRISLNIPEIVFDVEYGGYPPFKKGRKGSSEEISSNAGKALAWNVIQLSKQRDFIIIQNTINYIEDLNDGSSIQAHPNFIEDSIKANGKSTYRINLGRGMK